MDLRSLVDIGGLFRYKMPTAEKERIALQGELPGAPVDRTADQESAQRYAAGYLHTKAHPGFAKNVGIPVANFLHGLFGDNEAVQSQANAGMNRALLDLENEERLKAGGE